MRNARMIRPTGNRTLGRAALALGLAFAAAVTGCGDAARRADGYRVQQGLWEGYRAGQNLGLAGGVPDSASLLKVRQRFIDAVESAYPALQRPPGSPKRTPAEERLLQIVSQGEIEAARLAHTAGRPDLALERCRKLNSVAEGDTSVTRRADILIAGSLRRMGRHEEAIAAMKAMMDRYPPRAPDSTGVEDFVLSLPIVIADLRKDMGDDAALAGANADAERYYRGLLKTDGMAPSLEAQVRSRLVHTLLEQKRMPEAFAGLDSLEALVTSAKELTAMLPEIRYTRLKLRSMSETNHAETISGLERLAFSFPNSGAAPRALFDAAILLERSNRLDEARPAYAAFVSRYPEIPELASTALLRQGLLTERAGDWLRAKALLESVPANYPRTTAASQAPLSVVEHYMRVKDKAGVEVSLRKAAEQFERMARS
ncbi:MAG TPA: tetratricopeptide repeat protein, partial [Candidatus Eisenbacteria bacterium]|nr:tetratricopeptide repeat protein [Candidatus Eisenbacteria bacterium]